MHSQRFIALLASLLLLIFMSAPAFSLEQDQWGLDINVTSIHQKSTYGNGKKYNDDNFGLGASYGYSDTIEFKVGFYDNSFNKNTNYVAVVWQPNYYFNELRISPGVGGFLVTGYDGTPRFAEKIQPVAMPVITFGYNNYALNIGFLPSVKSNSVITFQLQFGF